MTATYCDITGNEIENATTNYAWRIRDSRYDVIRGRDFSVEGMKKLEDAVSTIAGIKRMDSINRESVSMLLIEFKNPSCAMPIGS